MVKLSVVIITFNEEKNIARCLDSVSTVADEIVVVDSYSTDNTEQICKSYGVSFVKHGFVDYVNQKNYANSKALHEYILSLDADEVLSKELKNSVMQAKMAFDADGYTMNRMTNYAGKWVHHCGWYPDRKMRLFDRRKGKWEGVIIHEQFKLQEGGRAEHLKGDLLHYSFHSVANQKKQTEIFTTLGAQADFKKGKKAPYYKIWLGPVVKFIQSYFIRLGFMDGRTGFIICYISAGATHTKYRKLRDLYKSEKKQKSE